MGKKAFGVCKRITYLVMPAGGGGSSMVRCPQVESRGREGNQASGTLSFQRDQHESTAGDSSHLGIGRHQ